MSKAKTKSTKPKAAKAVKPAKVERVEKNGITQPADGTACRAIWDLCDKLGKDITYEALREGIDAKVADATIRTQRQRWKTFNA